LLEDTNELGQIVQLDLDWMAITDKHEAKNKELENLQLSYHDRKKRDEL
jgi:hypothetical protein